jgi:hypothetical protein
MSVGQSVMSVEQKVMSVAQKVTPVRTKRVMSVAQKATPVAKTVMPEVQKVTSVGKKVQKVASNNKTSISKSPVHSSSSSFFLFSSSLRILERRSLISAALFTMAHISFLLALLPSSSFSLKTHSLPIIHLFVALHVLTLPRICDAF